MRVRNPVASHSKIKIAMQQRNREMILKNLVEEVSIDDTLFRMTSISAEGQGRGRRDRLTSIIKQRVKQK